MEKVEVEKNKVVAAYASATEAVKGALSDLFGKSFFVQKVTERIKSVEDAFAAVGKDYQAFETDCKLAGLTEDEFAYRKLKVIAQALNEGWTPDWGNSNEYKYYPFFNMGGSAGAGFSCIGCDFAYSTSCVGSRLAFKSSELAIYAGQQFTAIYKDFLTSK